MSKKLTNTDINKRSMIEALELCLGLVTHACKKVGISRETHYKWLRQDEEYRQKCDQVSELVIDMAESSLYKQINQGSTAATIFFLKTRGKKRGYEQDEPSMIQPKHEIVLTYDAEAKEIEK
tara:strand:- start:26 stop:391 length:366 start_codon:yes stop_codon:yes gene_type:complete